MQVSKFKAKLSKFGVSKKEMETRNQALFSQFEYDGFQPKLN